MLIVEPYPTLDQEKSSKKRFLIITGVIISLLTALTIGVGIIFLVTQSDLEQSNNNLPRIISPSKSEAVDIPTGFRVKAVIPAVVQLECFNNNYSRALIGSGYSFYAGNEHLIATNAHVVRVDDNPTGGCYVYFPRNDGSFYDSVYWAGEVSTYDDKKTTIDNVAVGGNNFKDGGVDYAELKITDNAAVEGGAKFPYYRSRTFPDINTIVQRTCKRRDIEIGERLFILGYPSVGGRSMTITEGIVSGLEGPLSEFIKTSAKVEKGNSGGLAIAEKDGCLLGMPTLVYIGEFESLAEILSQTFINEFVGLVLNQGQ